MALPNNPTQAQVVAEVKRLESAKADTSDIPTNYVTTDTAQTISGAKTLSNDLTFNASVQTQLIYKTNGTTTGLIRSGISNVGKYMITQADQHYWGSIANANRVIFDPVNKNIRPETTGGCSLGSTSSQWSIVYADEQIIKNRSSAYTDTPSSSSSKYLRFKDKNNVDIFETHATVGSDWNAQNFVLRNKSNTTRAIEFCHAVSNDNWRVCPTTTNSVDLGIASRTWRNIYGVNVYASSDRRLKENIKDAELDCGKVIDDLPIKEFNFKSDEEKKVVVGAIAQELQEILPEKYRATLVSGSEDTSYSINEGKLLYVAIGALKEERAKTKELEERLARLEAKLGV